MNDNQWQIMTLGEVAKCRNGAGIKQDFFSASGVPLARVSDFTIDSIQLQNCLYVDKNHAQMWSNHKLKYGDIVVATVGSWPPNWSSVVGKVVRVPIDVSGAIQNQNTVCVLANEGVTDQRFLYFLLKSKEFVYYAANTANGSANQARLAVANLEKFSFKLPPLPEQQAIAHILGSLDDKIELNRQMNETLEGIARALFKSWFVDFDPVRAKMEGCVPYGMDAETAALFPDGFEDSVLGEIPRGWSVTTIGEATRIVGGSTPSTKEAAYWDQGTIHWATPKDLSSLANAVLIETERCITEAGLQQISSGLLSEGTVLLSSRAPIGYLAITEIPVAINQGFIGLVCENELSNHYILQWLQVNMDVIKSRANGTTFLEISKSNFRPIPLVVPSNLILKVFQCQASSIHNQIVNNLQQNRTLSTLRDTLLPKLLSGEVRVGDVGAVI